MTKQLKINAENPEGILVDFTTEEQAQYDSDIAKNETDAVTRIEAEQDIKASAKAKLVAGEALTQEEADTIVL